MEHHAFAPVETHSEPPLLPRHKVSIDSERGAKRLVDSERLEICPLGLRLKVMVPFLGLMGDVFHMRSHAVARAEGQLDNINELLGDIVDDGRKWKRVVVRVGARVSAIFGVKIAL
jgi:hypothetical protein